MSLIDLLAVIPFYLEIFIAEEYVNRSICGFS